MISVIEKLDEYMEKRRAVRPCHVNNASSAGHPCERFLVYCRLNWKDKALPNLGLQYIFEEGNIHEQAVLRLLSQVGFIVIESQRSCDWPDLEVTGHIDGEIQLDGDLLPLEIKTSNQFTWEKLNTQEDLKASDKIWVKRWYGQLQMYLWMMSKPKGVLLLKNKQTGQLKQIDIEIDMDYSDALVKKLQSVNAHIKAKTYPQRITDRSACQGCDFRHICLPDEDSEQIQLTDDPDLLDLLEQREQLKDQAKEYEQIDKRLKEYYWKQSAPGTYLVGGKFQVKLVACSRTFYNVPADVKEPYKDKSEYMRAAITKVQ